MMTLAARLAVRLGDVRGARLSLTSRRVGAAPSSTRPAVPGLRRRGPVRWLRVSAARWKPPPVDGEDEREPTASQNLIDAMSTASRLSGRDPGGKVTTVMGDGAGGLGSNMSWEELDEKVNEYPCYRKFQAIGEGGEDFVAEIVGLVEGALDRKVNPEMVTSR